MQFLLYKNVRVFEQLIQRETGKPQSQMLDFRSSLWKFIEFEYLTSKIGLNSFEARWRDCALNNN